MVIYLESQRMYADMLELYPKIIDKIAGLNTISKEKTSRDTYT